MITIELLQSWSYAGTNWFVCKDRDDTDRVKAAVATFMDKDHWTSAGIYSYTVGIHGGESAYLEDFRLTLEETLNESVQITYKWATDEQLSKDWYSNLGKNSNYNPDKETAMNDVPLPINQTGFEYTAKRTDIKEPQPVKQGSANDKQVGGDHYKKHGETGEQHWDRIVRLIGWYRAKAYFVAVITKYVERHEDKNGIQDLEKAAHYLQKMIEEEKKYLASLPDKEDNEWPTLFDPKNLQSAEELKMFKERLERFNKKFSKLFTYTTGAPSTVNVNEVTPDSITKTVNDLEKEVQAADKRHKEVLDQIRHYKPPITETTTDNNQQRKTFTPETAYPAGLETCSTSKDQKSAECDHDWDLCRVVTRVGHKMLRFCVKCQATYRQPV